MGAVKNEFEKDVLKGLIDIDAIRLIILHGEYGHGTKGVVYGSKWFERPAQKTILERARILNLEVIPLPLIKE